jgi:hypothetical protein
MDKDQTGLAFTRWLNEGAPFVRSPNTAFTAPPAGGGTVRGVVGRTVSIKEAREIALQTARTADERMREAVKIEADTPNAAGEARRGEAHGQ